MLSVAAKYLHFENYLYVYQAYVKISMTLFYVLYEKVVTVR